MHTVAAARPTRRPAPRRDSAAGARVAVAGATGYTGQELLRLLARHPAVAIDGGDVVGRRRAARPLPALARLWNGAHRAARARRARARRRRRVPGAARRGRRRARAGARRRRRSRHRPVRRVPAARRRGARAVVSGNARGCPTASPTASPSASAARSRARGWSPTRAATRRRRCWRWRRSSTRGLLAARQPTSSSTPSRACRAPARRRPSARISPKCHGSLAAYGVFDHRHGAEIEQGVGGAGARSRRICVPLDRGILSTIYVRVAPGHDRGAARRRLRARVRATRRSSGWSARRCRKSSTSRTRTSATSAGASTRPAARFSCRSSTTC